MRKFLGLILYALIIMNVSHASENDFENAFIVRKSGDTLIGKIFYRGAKDLSYGINFVDSNAKDIMLLPDSIQYVLLPAYNVRYEPVTFKAKKPVTILASVVMKGAVNLYLSNLDPIKVGLKPGLSPFYIVQDSNATIPLISDPYSDLQEQFRFRGILNYVLRGCGNLSGRIGRMPYSLNEISNVIAEYNKCSGNISTSGITSAEAVHLNPSSQIPNKVYHQFMIGGIYSGNITRPASWHNGLYESSKYNNGIGLTLGYSVQAIYPSISKRIPIDFDFGLIYVHYKSENKYLNDDYHYFKGRIKILCGYILSDTKVKPIIQIGPSFQLENAVSLFPFMNAGFGLKWDRCFVSSVFETPVTFSKGKEEVVRFLSLNLKYTFAQSKKSKLKQ